MKIIHKLVSVLVFLVLITFGSLLLRQSTSVESWTSLVSQMASWRIEGVCFGLASILLALIYLLSGFNPKKKSQYLSFEQEGGTVSISTDAITDYISKLATEFPSVIKMRPVIKTGRNFIDIEIELKIKAGPQIHEVCEIIQQRVRESVSSGLGITDVRHIAVSVGGIISEHRP